MNKSVFFLLNLDPIYKKQILSEEKNIFRKVLYYVAPIFIAFGIIDYFTINNPIRDQQRILDAVKSGFIVRTRADANTIEARGNSTARRDAAFSSGAQYISTDYYIPRLDFSDYVVELPANSAARCNPVRRATACD